MVAPERSYDGESPAFCLRYVDPEYCITGCSAEQQAAFIRTLRELSQMTWIQIKAAHRHGRGTEKISQDAIRRPIPRHITADETLLAFRFWNRAPMVGYRERDVFRIIWFDPDFSLYDHG